MYSFIEQELSRETGSTVEIPEGKRWVKDREDWFVLMEEIMEEYLESPEYEEYLAQMEGQATDERGKLLCAIASKFRENALAQIEQNRQRRAE